MCNDRIYRNKWIKYTHTKIDGPKSSAVVLMYSSICTRIGSDKLSKWKQVRWKESIAIISSPLFFFEE